MVCMDEICENKLCKTAINDISINDVTIQDYCCELVYKFEWKGQVKSVLSDYYTSMYGDWVITETDAIKYSKNKDNIVKLIKQKHIRDNKINEVRRYKDVSANVYLEPKLYYKLSFNDGQTLWVSESVTLNTNNYYVPILNNLKNNLLNVSVDVSENNIYLVSEDYETIVSKENQPPDDTTRINDFVLEYLSDENKWLNAQIGNIIENNDYILISLWINDTKIHLEFLNSKNDNSKVGIFANMFDYDDPWKLQGELAQIAFNSPESVSYQYTFWNIRKPTRKRFIGIKSKISKILS